MVSNRIIKSSNREGSLELAHVLSSLLALELVAPSERLFIMSPWMSNTPLLDNRYGQLRGLLPDLPWERMRLAQIIDLLAERGARIYILCRPGLSEDFARLVKTDLRVSFCFLKSLHEKGLVSDHFYLRGSMNFTYSGININDEHLELTTDKQAIAAAQIEAEARWRHCS